MVRRYPEQKQGYYQCTLAHMAVSKHQIVKCLEEVESPTRLVCTVYPNCSNISALLWPSYGCSAHHCVAWQLRFFYNTCCLTFFSWEYHNCDETIWMKQWVPLENRPKRMELDVSTTIQTKKLGGYLFSSLYTCVLIGNSHFIRKYI